MPEVSVLIPLYGDHRGRHTLPTVTRAWLSQSVPCEVVIATAGPMDVTVAEAIDAARTVRVVEGPAACEAAGRLRNVAEKHARASVLYLGDADTAPQGRGFLARALELADGKPITQPWVYRVVGGFDGLDPMEVTAAASERFCYATFAPDGRLHPYGGEQYVIRHDGVGVEVPIVQPPSQMPEAIGGGDWRAPFHYGALMLRRQLFHDVGGYCRRYLGWGRQDDDLLLKISSRSPVVRAWQAAPDLHCVHFEHERPYMARPRTKENFRLYDERAATGPAAMIAEDCAAWGEV